MANSNFVKTSSANISATETVNLVVGLTVKLYGPTSKCIRYSTKYISKCSIYRRRRLFTI